MTAEIFLQRRAQIDVGGILVGFVLAIATFFFTVIHFTTNNNCVGFGALAAAIVYLTPIPLTNILKKRFTQKHPEMDFIWDWVNAGEELKDYPTDEKDKAEVENLIYGMLLSRARAADAAMQIRDRIIAAEMLSPSAFCEYNRAVKDLSARAKCLNDRYLSFWDLAVVKMKRFSRGTNPREFREMNREILYQ